MMIYAKIKNFSLNLVFLVFIVFTTCFYAQSQVYSVDKEPQKKLTFNIHLKGLFKTNEQKKAVRKKRKEENKSSRNEIKTKKKYWKHLDRPKELGTDKKVVKRMKKNLRVSKRVNHNKHKEGTVKRLSRKKIKLPKISISKIHWPWTKKASSD
jgi:hypothetical protein